MVGVKVPYKYGPYSSTEEAFKRRARSPEEFSVVVGQDMADATMEGFLQYGMAALKAAISGNADMVATGNWAADSKKVLTKGLRKFGDKSGRVLLWAMDSTTYFDMVDQAIADKIYEEAGVVIYGGLPGTLGKPVLVSDAFPEQNIFGLQSGAVRLTESQAPGFRAYDINDQENLAIGMRAEGTVNIDLLGYSWQEAAGGVNPTVAALGTAANWAKHVTSNKLTAGVLIDLSTQSGG